MNNKSIYLLALLFFVCILSISAISATENTTSKEISNTDNNAYSYLETTNHQHDDVTHSKNNNVEIKEKENNNNVNQGKSKTDETPTENEEPLSFTDLYTTINSNTNSTIYLSHNYKYNHASDSGFTNGIPISRNVTIYGNGITLDGNKMARIFNVAGTSVNFYNINFINGKGYNGGAINQGNTYNCNFINNTADCAGGAIYKGNAYNCTFTGNTAKYGGAKFKVKAYNCTFSGNTATLSLKILDELQKNNTTKKEKLLKKV